MTVYIYASSSLDDFIGKYDGSGTLVASEGSGSSFSYAPTKYQGVAPPGEDKIWIGSTLQGIARFDRDSLAFIDATGTFGPPTGMVASASGVYVANGASNTVELMDSTLSVIAGWDPSTFVGSSPRLALSPDGTILYSADSHSTIHVLNVSTGATGADIGPIVRLGASDPEIKAVCVRSNGELLASGRFFLYRITPAGVLLDTYGIGSDFSGAGWPQSQSVAVDAEDKVWVMDNVGQLYRFDPISHVGISAPLATLPPADQFEADEQGSVFVLPPDVSAPRPLWYFNKPTFA